jgi:transposase
VGYSGWKHQKGVKELTLADNNGFVIAPLVVSSVNNHDSILFPYSLNALMEIAALRSWDLQNSFLTLDAGFDSEANRALIRWHDLTPVIKPNPRRLKDQDLIDELYLDFRSDIYKERFKIERTFAWADTYRKLVIRYEKLECTHNGFRYLAYSMINLRVFFKKIRGN